MPASIKIKKVKQNDMPVGYSRHILFSRNRYIDTWAQDSDPKG